MTNMASSIGLRHTIALELALHGMRRQRRGRGIVQAAQCVTVSRKHDFVLI